ncbi:nicotinate-nucleotide adenylyltransferase [Filobacillus milosensis]|uniref:Probable nicotinate-nucleotide adenylyltransferase n=1 Tax=Filobacillus milosensis TaxID=94137 RepID=A0A4Y8ISV7_9BACI|nr:nicotinate-nucleotide adenylyltransferase [Filobacillus milosensis]TFB24872.1 nicotinate-nucleotide adenylyltransferase [Filobacillus milosensis]
MKKIGLFGGTFDPPHIGHVKLAQTVQKKLNLDEVWLIPTYHPPHKTGAKAHPNERLDMLNLLLKDLEHKFKVSTIEYNLKGKSYTVETVKHLINQYPDVSFYFIIGGDMIDYLPKWYKIDELKKLVQFVGVTREGFEQASDPDVIMVEMEDVPVSSTKIRKELKAEKVPYGLTDNVLLYIRENQLYED